MELVFLLRYGVVVSTISIAAGWYSPEICRLFRNTYVNYTDWTVKYIALICCRILQVSDIIVNIYSSKRNCKAIYVATLFQWNNLHIYSNWAIILW